MSGVCAGQSVHLGLSQQELPIVGNPKPTIQIGCETKHRLSFLTIFWCAQDTFTSLLNSSCLNSLSKVVVSFKNFSLLFSSIKGIENGLIFFPYKNRFFQLFYKKANITFLVTQTRGVYGVVLGHFQHCTLRCGLAKTITAPHLIFAVTCVVRCGVVYSLAKTIIALHLIFAVTCAVQCGV